MRRNRGTKGAVSVFLAIILVPCIIVSSIFVDVSRVQLSKTVSESAADLAMNSLLTNYDADLKEWYGMIASCQNIEQFYEASANLFVRTLASQGLSDDEIVLLSDYYSYVTGDDTIYDLLSVSPQSEASGMIQEVSDANLSNASLIKDQVVEFMKYRAPIEIATNLLTRIKNDPTSEDAVQASVNEPLVEDKQEFYESEGELVEAAFESYKAIKAYHDRANTDGLTNDMLSGIYGKLEGYKTAYKEALRYAVTFQSGAENLPTQYTRPTRTITYYNDYYSNPSRNFSEVYTDDEKVDGKTVYYIDLSDAEDLVEDLSAKITAFETAKTNYANAAAGALSDLPFSTTESNNANATRWYLKMYNAIYNSGTNHHSKVQTAADNMMRAYSRVLAIDKCEVRGTPPEDWDSLDDWYEEYDVANIRKKAENMQARYLKSGVKDDSDSYLKAVRYFESASSVSNSEKNKFRVTVDGTAYAPSAAIEQISTKLTNTRKQLKEISDLLDKAIGNQKKKTGLYGLSDYVDNYDKTLSAWDKSSKTTYHKGKLTNMADGDKEEIQKKKEDGAIVEIKKEDVQTLITRLSNIKKQLDDAISAIDSMKWNSKAIKDIDSYDTFKSKAGIKQADIGIKNSAVTSYVNSLFDQKFAPATMPTFKHANDSSYNPLINPVSMQVDTPYLWHYLFNKYNGYEEKLEETKKEKDAAKKTGDKKAEDAKNAERYTYKGANVKWEYSAAETFALTELGNSLMNFIEAAVGEESALAGMRDDLFVTAYIMEMFSHAAYEKEGKYRLLDEDTQKTLTFENYENSYKTVSGGDSEIKDGTWASENPVDHYNKTLTNKQITTANNAAYCAEIEYILCGGNGKTNAENVKAVFGSIYTVRYALNLVSAFQHFWGSDTTTGNLLNVMANAVSGLTQGLIPAPVIKVVILPVFAIFETSTDMDRLQAGFPVEIYKTQASMWWCALETNGKGEKDTSISAFINKITSIDPKLKTNTGAGIFYSDYLMLFVYLGISGDSGNAMLQRMAEVIQFNIATMSKDSSYSLKKSRMYFTLTSDLRVDPLMIDLPIFTNNGYAESLTTEFDWCTYKTKITRGYP